MTVLRKYCLASIALGLSCFAAACTVVSSSDDDDGTGGSGGTESDSGAGGGSGGTESDGGGSGGAGGSSTGGSGGTGTGGGDSDAGSGGSAGDGGSDDGGSDPDGGDTPPYVEGCGTDGGLPDGDNDTMETAADVTSSATLCLETDDEDWLKLTAPEGSGAYIVKIEVNPELSTRVRLVARAGADNSEIGTVTMDEGTDRTLYLTVGAGTTTYLQLTDYFGPGLANLTLTWTPEADTHEDNNVRDDAASIELNTDVTAQFVIPYVQDDQQVPDDWYSVTLAAGDATIRVTDVPDNVRLRVRVLDPSNAEVDNTVSPNPGALFDTTFTADAPGTYRFVVEDYFSTDFTPLVPDGMPEHLTQSYTLRVEQ